MERYEYHTESTGSLINTNRWRVTETFCNFYIIRRDCEKAWRIKDYQLTKECAKEIWLDNAKRYEHFFHIPYQEAELVNIA